jgi:hypothetical protein
MKDELMTETPVLEQVDKPTITQEEFSIEVESRAWSDKNDCSYIYHAAKYIDELDLDPEDGKALISPSLLDKIKNEAMSMRLLKERVTTSSVLSFN